MSNAKLAAVCGDRGMDEVPARMHWHAHIPLPFFAHDSSLCLWPTLSEGFPRNRPSRVEASACLYKRGQASCPSIIQSYLHICSLYCTMKPCDSMLTTYRQAKYLPTANVNYLCLIRPLV